MIKTRNKQDYLELNSYKFDECLSKLQFLRENAMLHLPITLKISSTSEKAIEIIDLLDEFNLEDLQFKNVVFSEVEQFTEAIKSVSQYKSIKSISISVNPYIQTIESSKQLFVSFKHLPKYLHSLSIEINFFSRQDNVSHFFLQNIQRLPQRLKRLDLLLDGFNNLNELAHKLSQLPQTLEYFSLSALNHEVSSTSLFSCFNRLPRTIKYLFIYLENVDDSNNLHEYIQDLPNQIVELSLQFKASKLNSNSAALFSESIAKNLPHLQQLKLDFNNNVKQSYDFMEQLLHPLNAQSKNSDLGINHLQLNLANSYLDQPLQSLLNSAQLLSKLLELSLDLTNCTIDDEEFMFFFDDIHLSSPQLVELSLVIDSPTLNVKSINYILNKITNYDSFLPCNDLDSEMLQNDSQPPDQQSGQRLNDKNDNIDISVAVQDLNHKQYQILSKSMKKLSISFNNSQIKSKFEELKIPNNLIESVSKQLTHFSLKFNYYNQPPLLKMILFVYKQLHKLDLRMSHFTFELSNYYMKIVIVDSYLSFSAISESIISKKEDYKQFKIKMSQILLDTPPQLYISNLNISPSIEF